MRRRRVGTGVGGVALGLMAAMAAAAPAAPAATTTSAADQVRHFIAANSGTCPHFTIESVAAEPTTPDEVTDKRPAGYDVTVRLSGPASGPAVFLVTRTNRVVPDNAVAGAVALGCRRDPPAPKSALAWHALPYEDLAGGMIQAGSDGSWHGAYPNRNLPTFSATFPEGNGTPIWARSCSRGPQLVKFDRTLYLLAEPDSLSFLLTAAVKGSGARPLRWVELLVNGRSVYRSTASGNYAAGQLDHDALAAVRFGANSFEVVVSKPPSNACNSKTAPDQYGVHFAIAGHFHADAGGGSLAPTGTISCGQTTCNGQAELPFRLTNQGPSELLEPRFDATLTTSGANEVNYPSFSATENGLTNVRCRSSHPSATRYRLFCDWGPMAATSSGWLEFKFSFHMPLSQATHAVAQAWKLVWSFPGAYGSSSQNASGTRSMFVCGPAGSGCPQPITYESAED